MRKRIVTAFLVPLLLAASCHADELAPEAILTSFERGGKIMWVILAASMAGCAFAAERLIAIRRRAQIPVRLMTELRDAMVSGGVAAGLRVVEGNRSALGRVMYALLSRSGATRRELENTVDDETSRILYDLRANLKPIGVIASISPLLGLLGTVFGLIAAFRAAAELGMDDPRNFAAGIYEALYTTAFGLVVAIPLLIVYHLLRNHADSIMREVEERALAFISAASSRAETRRSPAPDADAAVETMRNRAAGMAAAPGTAAAAGTVANAETAAAAGIAAAPETTAGVGRAAAVGAVAAAGTVAVAGMTNAAEPAVMARDDGGELGADSEETSFEDDE